MNKYVILMICIGMFIACHKKAVPVVTARTAFPEPPKTTQPAPIEATAPEFMAAGKTIYEGKCIRCHDMKPVDAYTPDRWTSILKSMIPKTRLNDEQARQVTAYVMANAKK